MSSFLRIFSKPYPFFPAGMILVLGNTVISLLIAFPVLQKGVQEITPIALMLDSIPYFSHYFMLNLLVGSILFAVSFALPRKIIPVINTVVFSLVQMILLVDTRIFMIFHYHINALVLNVMTTEGAGDSVILGKGTLLVFLFILLLVLVCQIIMNRFIGKISELHKRPGHALLSRGAVAILVLGLCVMLLDKSLYAYADIVNNVNIIRKAKLYPLYQPLTVKRFARKVLHIEVNREEEFKMNTNQRDIHYPKEQIRFDPLRDKKYNVIILAVEGLRFDMLDPEIMPNTWKFSRQNLTFTNHYSGGNGSRFGIFSLFYGIHGSYWHTFLSHRISPVLMDAMIGKGYDFSILSSTMLTFPEFRKTAFIRVPSFIEDSFETSDMIERDRIIADKLIAYASSHSKEKPFFSYLFFNSSHQMYKYPPEFGKFLPVVQREDVNYFTDTEDRATISMIKNRYMNAVYYVDSLIGKIIASLEKQGLMDKTVLLITGDHGDEFYENGYFGHTSAFGDYQIRTVFILHVPGEHPRSIERLTSHMDFVPTIMELMGTVTPVESYSQGLSLLGNRKHDYVSSANWDTAAMIDDQVKIVYSTELYNIDKFEVRNKGDYVIVPNTREMVRQKKGHLAETFRSMSEFYR